MNARKALTFAAFGISLATLLSGCSYDYLQHTDQVGYKAGDAVAANLEAETIDPSKHSMYVTSGLGKNGVVKLTGETPATGSTSAPAAGSPAPAPALQ